MNRNKIIDNEINLLEILLIIWNKKITVIQVTLLSVLLMFFYQSTSKPKEKILTFEIQPISIYLESKYLNFNSFIKKFESQILKYKTELNNSDLKNELIEQTILQKKSLNQLLVDKIDKKILLEMFVEHLDDKLLLLKILKEFRYLKEDSYSNKQEYEDALNQVVQSFSVNKENIYKNLNLLTYAKYKGYDTDRWREFVPFYKKAIDTEIQSKILLSFNEYLKYEEYLVNFEIEDLQEKIKFVQNDEEKINLEIKLNFLKANKNSDRIKKLIEETTFLKKNNFVAADIIEVANSKDVKNRSVKLQYILAGLIGMILGIILALIQNSIQNSIQNKKN